MIGAVTSTLAEAADPERAGPMQAYMKSAMPYYGVAMPEVRKRVRRVYDDLRIDSGDAWEATIRRLYDEATTARSGMPRWPWLRTGTTGSVRERRQHSVSSST